MVPFVEDAVADEELRSESPLKLLIINRCALRVVLSRKIPLYLVELGFICQLFSLNVTTMCGFVQPLNGDSGSLVVPPDLEHRRHPSYRVR